MRQKPHQEKNYPVIYRLLLAIGVLLWIYAFYSYFRYYDSLHPKITWATPWVETNVVAVEGVLLWNETVLIAPKNGAVSYPVGVASIRVGKGDTVALLTVGSTSVPVKAPDGGYFMAGVDGNEGNWTYSKIWPGTELFSKSQVKLFKEGQFFRKGETVGKLILQPQDLRFVGYLDLNPKVEKQLEKGYLDVKQDKWDTASRATVRVYERYGSKIKVYLTLPWFGPEVVNSRNYSLLVEVGQTRGLAVPESALTTRFRKQGVFVLRGTRSLFQAVEGQPIDGKLFLVTEGLQLGDAVLEEGSKAREGRVKLW